MKTIEPSFLPLDPARSPRYCQLSSFARLRTVDDFNEVDFDVGILGIPYDGGASYRPGTRFGPEAIRRSSRLIRSYSPAQYCDLFARERIVDLGDLDISPYMQAETFEKITTYIRKVGTQRRKLLILGGDHSISLPVIRALSTIHGTLSFIQFDAHSDTYGPAYGSDYHHGTIVRHMIEEGLIDPNTSMQIGLRGQLSTPSDYEYAKSKGLHLVTTQDIYQKGLDPIRNLLVQASVHPIYVSFDIDVVDPAFAPGTGTPVPGGISSYQAFELVRQLKNFSVIGGDVVEVSPAYDHAEITSLLAANLAYEILCLFNQEN